MKMDIWDTGLSPSFRERIMTETLRDRALQAVRETAQEQGAQKAIVFGSFARDTATRHSDLDAVFVADTRLRFMDRPDPYLSALQDRLGLASDVFVYTPAEFADMADKPFMKRVLREGVSVYER